MNSPKDCPRNTILRALPLLFSKYLETDVDAVCAISPCPDNLKKNIPKNKKMIPLIKEKNNVAKNKKIATKME